MNKPFLLIILLTISFILFSEPIEITLEITGSRNQNLQADFLIPTSETTLPCLIVTPGKGYHKDLPITSILAKKAFEAGFISIKFNWDYFTQNSEPKQWYDNEFQDLKDIISYAKTIPEIDSTRIYLAGKSLGSFITYNVLAEDSLLAGAILLTPIIPNQEYGENLYPGLKTINRNISFIVGNKDYDNCPIKELYNFVSDAQNDIPVTVVGGDHGLNIGSYKDEKYIELNLQNIETAVQAAINQLLIWDFPNLKE